MDDRSTTEGKGTWPTGVGGWLCGGCGVWGVEGEGRGREEKKGSVISHNIIVYCRDFQ